MYVSMKMKGKEGEVCKYKDGWKARKGIRVYSKDGR